MGSDKPSGADNQQERPDLAQWVVGFVDGEGCFSVPIVRNTTCRVGWQVQPAFTVVQAESSNNTLILLEAFFKCGRVGCNTRHDNHREPMWYFTVRNRHDLSRRIVPFFEEHPLITAKADAFEKFCSVLRMMDQDVHRSVDGLVQIAKVAEQMNRRKPSRFLESSEAIRQPSRTTTR